MPERIAAVPWKERSQAFDTAEQLVRGPKPVREEQLSLRANVLPKVRERPGTRTTRHPGPELPAPPEQTANVL